MNYIDAVLSLFDLKLHSGICGGFNSYKICKKEYKN